MWNEESSLAVNSWRNFLNEEKPPELGTVDVEEPTEPTEPIKPIEPIEPGAPPAAAPPQKPPKEELEADLELAKKHYPMCQKDPDRCTRFRPETLSSLATPIYDRQITLTLDDIPSDLSSFLNPIGKGVADDGTEFYFDEITNERVSENFYKFVNRPHGWVQSINIPNVRTVKSPVKFLQNGWGVPFMKIYLTSLGRLNGADTTPYFIEDISPLIDTGDEVAIGYKFKGWSHVSHLKGGDIDVSIPLKKDLVPWGQSVRKDFKGLMRHDDSRLLNPETYLDKERSLDFLRHTIPYARFVFIEKNIRNSIENYAKNEVVEGRLPQEEFNSIFKSNKITPGCAKKVNGKPVANCRNHNNHFHVRLLKKYAPPLAPVRISYAPWYRETATTGKYINIPKVPTPIGTEKIKKLYDPKGKLTPAQLRAFRDFMDLTKKKLKEYKFKELIRLIKEWKNKEYLIEQSMMDPAMMDPAAQRMQMQKQVIQMQLGPIMTQAADIMFTLNSLEDPAAKQQARMYADRIQGAFRDFLSGDQEPVESIQKLGPIVDEMGRRLQKFMS